ncbi:MAG: DUF1631 domain-containing protein [Gammaproteobacteria bacterium]|nr:DUF1631 domain-containing protein [Gammaproteobacteria bacterium]
MAKVTRLVPLRSNELLGECYKLVSERLPDLLKLLLDKADDAFFELANKADSSQRQQTYFDAMRELRLKRLRMAADFTASLKTTFNASVSTPITKPRPPATFEDSPALSLVSADDVEESLAITNFVENLKSRCKNELFALDQRIGHLLSDPELSASRNPFGPTALGDALRAMGQRLEAHIEVRLALLKLCERYAGPGLLELYHTLNAFLIREDVLPRLTPNYVRNPSSSLRTRVIIETEEGAQEATGADVFQTLQQLMRPGTAAAMMGSPSFGAASGPGMGANGGFVGAGAMASGHPGISGFAAGGGSINGGGSGVVQAGGGGAGGDAGGLGASGMPGVMMVPVATTAFVSNLTQLQHGNTAGVAAFANLDPSLLQTGAVNVLRTLRQSGAAAELNQTDTLTLDIVTLLFDYILDDPAIQDSVKALIGRLQIPMLKVALLDKDLFSKKNHPARQLLDGLAASAVGWSEHSTHGDALFEKFQYIVYRVVEEFDRDLGLFTQLLDELNAFLAEDRTTCEKQAELSTNSLRTKERIVLAKLAVDEVVKGHFEGAEVREFIKQFIRDYWRQQLIVTYIEAGPQSDLWRDQLNVIDELVWSVQPKTGADDRRELTNRLPKLLKTLKTGMRELNMEPAVCSKFLTMLASVHVVSVKQVEEATLAERKITQIAAAEAETKAVVQSEEEFVKKALERLFARKSVDASELDFDLSALEAEVAAEPVEEIPAPDDEFMEKVMELDLGDWLEFSLPDATTLRARFTWISEATGRYLFTDRQGRKAFDLTMNGLIDQFRVNTVKRVRSQPDPLFERALGELMERLEKQVA